MAEAHSVEEVKKHVKVYIAVFVALAVLTVVTVVVGYLHLPIVPALIVALVIATIKGGLVAGYFMHLVSERKIVLYLLVLTGVFLLAMLVIFAAAYYDQDGGIVIY